MSLFGTPPPSASASGLPRGELLGNYRTFEEAQKVVDQLTAGEITLDRLTIVGRDVRVVNRLRKRLSYPSVVLRSAIQGGFFGIIIGLLLSAIAPTGDNFQLLSSIVLGVSIWVIFGVLGQVLRRKGPSFEVMPQVVATSYDLVCDFEVSGRARRVLAGSATSSSSTTPSTPAATDSQSAATPVTPPAGDQQVTPPPTEPRGDTGENQPQGASEEQEERTWQLRDLPDGRPQFGVRVDPEDPVDQPDSPESPQQPKNN